MGGIAGAASTSDQVSDSSLCPDPSLLSCVLAGITSLGEAKGKNCREPGTINGKSPAAASLIAQMLSPPLPSSACLSLHPLTSGNWDPELFLGAEKLKAEPCLCQMLAQCLPVCVPLGLSVFLCVESAFCNRQMGMKYFKNVS